MIACFSVIYPIAIILGKAFQKNLKPLFLFRLILIWPHAKSSSTDLHQNSSLYFSWLSTIFKSSNVDWFICGPSLSLDSVPTITGKQNFYYQMQQFLLQIFNVMGAMILGIFLMVTTDKSQTHLFPIFAILSIIIVGIYLWFIIISCLTFVLIRDKSRLTE